MRAGLSVDVLIFSKDRPAQLDLLLQSIERYASHVYSRIEILTHWTGEEYRDGYARCGRSWSGRNPAITLIPQGSFQEAVRRFLDRAGDVVSFLVDDDIFYRPADPPYPLPWSYRIPRSVNWRMAQMQRDAYGQSISNTVTEDDAYPLSLDGNVYAKADLLPLLDFPFGDPTQLEAGLHNRRDQFTPDWIYSRGQSLVGIPANRVSDSSGMPHMDVSPATLNDRFLAGERISLDATLGGVEIVGAHQEIGYQWC